ncbi:hypothetical protein QJQ45_029646 [Haematococcus lacustris]|nr:hypothetical protein QJQ45_029646 [Haematococcus lacustris]
MPMDPEPPWSQVSSRTAQAAQALQALMSEEYIIAQVEARMPPRKRGRPSQAEQDERDELFKKFKQQVLAELKLNPGKAEAVKPGRKRTSNGKEADTVEEQPAAAAPSAPGAPGGEAASKAQPAAAAAAAAPTAPTAAPAAAPAAPAAKVKAAAPAPAGEEGVQPGGAVASNPKAAKASSSHSGSGAHSSAAKAGSSGEGSGDSSSESNEDAHKEAAVQQLGQLSEEGVVSLDVLEALIHKRMPPRRAGRPSHHEQQQRMEIFETIKRELLEEHGLKDPGLQYRGEPSAKKKGRVRPLMAVKASPGGDALAATVRQRAPKPARPILSSPMDARATHDKADRLMELERYHVPLPDLALPMTNTPLSGAAAGLLIHAVMVSLASAGDTPEELTVLRLTLADLYRKKGMEFTDELGLIYPFLKQHYSAGDWPAVRELVTELLARFDPDSEMEGQEEA